MKKDNHIQAECWRMPDGIRHSALLLEDEIIIALDFESALLAQGFEEVFVFATTAGAREWLRANRPSVAVVDLTLEDGPSHAVIELLRAMEVPIVICTGKTDDPLALAFSGHPVFHKPCDSGEVARAAVSVAVASTGRAVTPAENLDPA